MGVVVYLNHHTGLLCLANHAGGAWLWGGFGGNVFKLSIFGDVGTPQDMVVFWQRPFDGAGRLGIIPTGTGLSHRSSIGGKV